jgi:hypothetical protein
MSALYYPIPADTGGAPTNPIVLAADPRSGTGRVATAGQWGSYAGVMYQCVGTGANDWVKVPFYARTTVTGAAATAITFSGLNGDADKVYNWEAYIVSVTHNSACTLKPNNVGTNQASVTYYNNGAASGPAGSASLFLGTQKVTGGSSYVRSRGTINAKTGVPRLFHNVAYEFDNGAVVYVETSEGLWTDTASNITSLVFTAADASSIGVGSVITVWSPAEGYYL